MADGFVQLQRDYWNDADEEHFAWQTRHQFIAQREAQLLSCVATAPGERILEIGCGEGANLHHLRERGALRFGLDFSPAKASFARRATDARTVTGDAARLPFGDATFDAILIRDVLHHVPDQASVLAEARRVLKPRGRLTLLEPNARSPLVLAQAALVPAERGLFSSTVERLRAALGRSGFTVVGESAEHPFPIDRVLLHPRLGMPSLASLPLVTPALHALDRLARRLLPRRAWMYLVFEAVPAEVR
jgi:SAM-dependent methyltransferase